MQFFLLEIAASIIQSNIEPRYSIYLDLTEQYKNLNFSIIAKGDPAPSVIWTLNGQNVDQLKEFKVKQYTRKEKGIFYVHSSVSKDFGYGQGGVLKVLASHGGNSPSASRQTTIEVESKCVYLLVIW